MTHNLISIFSEAQRNFRNKLFDSAETQRKSAIAERDFCTKSKRNLNSAIKFIKGNANSAYL